MLPSYIKKNIKKDDMAVAGLDKDFQTPAYDPRTHYLELCASGYYHALLILRHHIKSVSEYYFGCKLGAKSIDLFMITPSISSPIGPGSDSEVIKIKLGKYETCLVDSSQFGFEPLLMNGFDKVYCYLPSMRGEDPDDRHLNQFYHCEMEMKGTLKNLIPIIEDYIKNLCMAMLLMDNIIMRISDYPEIAKKMFRTIVKAEKFPSISFDKAIKTLEKNGKADLIHFTPHGRDLTSEAELELIKTLDIKTPFWITNYDRDRVPFYQKPDPKDPAKVINADLIFPSFNNGSFGGEIVGCGQRQDNEKEMRESLRRQKISPDSYEWYIELRKQIIYKTTSGFGMGIERFIAWALMKKSIIDVIPYPRLKNVKTYP